MDGESLLVSLIQIHWSLENNKTINNDVQAKQQRSSVPHLIAGQFSASLAYFSNF